MPPVAENRPRWQPVQVFLAGGAVLALLAALVLALQPQPELRAVHLGMAGATVASSALFAWLARRRTPLTPADSVLLATLTGVALVLALGWVLDTGLRTIALGLLPLMVGLAVLLAGGWRAVLVVAVSVLGIGLLAWHDRQTGGEAMIAAIRRLTVASGLWSHAVMLLGGVIVGLVARRLAQRWRALADEREHQFRELLGTVADLTIELDADLRFARPSSDIGVGRPMPAHFVGRHPWDTPGLAFDPGQAEAHRQDLLARRPFDIEVTSQLEPDGPPLRLAISGRPRMSGEGRFLGYWCVGRDVTAQQRQREATRRAAAEAEAASRAKSSFLANLSHEVRTPLNGILGLAHLARRHADEPERVGRYLQLIGDSATTLHATLSNVLDQSRAEAGQILPLPERVDLEGLLRSVVGGYEPLCQSRGLACSLQLDAGLPRWVMVDGIRLRQILTNLLDNALKFTPQGRIGLVAGALPDGRVRLVVHDSGPGIAEADRAQLFQPFSQAGPGSQGRHGGSGLGLSICRQLARAMGGEVGVDSQPGAGSRFWVELPMPAVAPAPAAAPEAPSLAGLTALVVEDNPVNMLITVAQLESWGMRVEQAGDGQSAIDTLSLRSESFDVVLMDLQMPGLDGLATTRQLRAAGVHTPIVALTASALDGDRQAAREAGFDALLCKPLEIDRLQAQLLALQAHRGGAAAPPEPGAAPGR